MISLLSSWSTATWAISSPTNPNSLAKPSPSLSPSRSLSKSWKDWSSYTRKTSSTGISNPKTSYSRRCKKTMATTSNTRSQILDSLGPSEGLVLKHTAGQRSIWPHRLSAIHITVFRWTCGLWESFFSLCYSQNIPSKVNCYSIQAMTWKPTFIEDATLRSTFNQ